MNTKRFFPSLEIFIVQVIVAGLVHQSSDRTRPDILTFNSFVQKVNNLTLLEINTVRNLLSKTLKEVYKLKQHVITGEE